jgi:hypothetical protein
LFNKRTTKKILNRKKRILVNIPKYIGTFIIYFILEKGKMTTDNDLHYQKKQTRIVSLQCRNHQLISAQTFSTQNKSNRATSNSHPTSFYQIINKAYSRRDSVQGYTRNVPI